MAKHHTGQYYEKIALRHGLEVERGKGSHVKVYSPKIDGKGHDPLDRGFMTIPSGDLANGTERSIIKWFAKLGIICILVFIMILLFL